MKFFPTQLQTYQQCPRKFFYSRDKEIRAKYAKTSPAMHLGNAVHDALQMFFDISKTPMADRTYERLCGLFREAWAGRGLFARNLYRQTEAREQAFAKDRDSEKAWGEKGLNILFRFFQTADVKAVPLTAEQFHEILLAPDVTLGGKIDRIDRLPDGRLVVLDYKTGKPPYKDKGSPESLARDDLQLAAYAVLVTKKFRGKVARCEYLFLDHELTLGYEPTDDLLAAKEAEILALCRTILGDETFEPTPNNLCPWCEYKTICPKGEEWEKAHGPGAAAAGEEIPF
jgi:putative RecB family exonuclease